MKKFAVKLAVWLLRQPLSLEQKSMLINAILDRLVALPLHDIISITEEGSLQVNGKTLNYEEARLVKESASALRGSRAFGLIQDSVLFQALTIGVNSATDFSQVYFAKAAVWWGQQENRVVNLLADYNLSLVPRDKESA